ncbi:MAG: peptidoglycan DD-metalloendopeptidase family protein [Lachnospiraceae bacterium]|nr:peptidoglycan DD-metalloendopeptidase family protein [Lachnospiraceae bacterium]
MDRIRPYKNRKQAVKREKIIMFASSAVVLAALTMTGVYMKEKNAQEQDGNYSVDLAQLETNVEDKYTELVEDVQPPVQVADNSVIEDTPVIESPMVEGEILPDEELDYMPWEESIVDDSPVAEVNSGLVEIPGLTDIVEEAPIEEAPAEVLGQEVTFAEEEGLYAPTTGEVLMHYNMDNTVYFATLDQYKYNPAVIYQAEVGSYALACADGIVKEVFQNEEIGHAMVLDLGNGYEVTYGQLAAYNVNVGDYVTANQVIATIASPTKYYVTEGCNLYFAMEKDGEAINPEELMP